MCFFAFKVKAVGCSCFQITVFAFRTPGLEVSGLGSGDLRLAENRISVLIRVVVMVPNLQRPA